MWDASRKLANETMWNTQKKTKKRKMKTKKIANGKIRREDKLKTNQHKAETAQETDTFSSGNVAPLLRRTFYNYVLHSYYFCIHLSRAASFCFVSFFTECAWNARVHLQCARATDFSLCIALPVARTLLRTLGRTARKNVTIYEH